MQKISLFLIVISFSCLIDNKCLAAKINETSKEKTLQVSISFETSRVLTKQKAHLIQESISSRIKKSFKGIIRLQEFKVVDLKSLINQQTQNNQNFSATLLISHADNRFTIKINFTDYDSTFLFPTQQSTCENQNEIPFKTLDLFKEYLTPKALITRKLNEDVYELQFENNSQLKTGYASPKKGDYFQILRKTQTNKANNIYKWTVLQLLETVNSNQNNIIFKSKLYSGIELPNLSGFKAIKIPNGPIDIGFKITPSEHSQAIKNTESYFPVDVLLRPSFKVGMNQEKHISRTDNQGIFRFPTNCEILFPGVAFVEIIRNNSIVAQFPFFKTSNEPESITINFEPEKPYEKQKALWLIQVNDQLAFMSALFRELNKPDFKNEVLNSRIEKIDKLAKFSFEKVNNIKTGLQDLKSKWPDIITDNELKLGEKKLGALLGYIGELNNYQARLVKIEADKNSPQRKALNFKITEAKRMAGDGDFPQAITLLESILNDAPEVETDIKQFKELWLNKSAKVMEARKFLFDSLPNLSVIELSKQTTKLISSVEICIAESDTAGLLKYMKHSRDLYLQLDPSQNDQDKSNTSSKESLELITLLEEENKRVKIFFESLNKKP
ncbi:MAG: hypothetical protein EBT92_08455 [Planctomycetes bacterium]|nr:hypothetical protein [Planctomycetota bacterium]